MIILSVAFVLAPFALVLGFGYCFADLGCCGVFVLAWALVAFWALPLFGMTVSGLATKWFALSLKLVRIWLSNGV